MINFLEVNWKSNLFSNKFNNVVGDIWTTNLPQTFFQILRDMKHILFFDWAVYCTVNILYFGETVHITQCSAEKNLHLKAMYSSAAIFIYNPFLFLESIFLENTNFALSPGVRDKSLSAFDRGKVVGHCFSSRTKLYWNHFKYLCTIQHDSFLL